MTTTNEQNAARGDAGTRSARRPGWLRQIWVAPLAVYCLVFAGYALARYVTFDPRVADGFIRTDVPIHFPLFALHVDLGAVAIIMAWMQVWPWLRNNHPKVHRISGWIYFIGGVFPAGLLALVIAVLAVSKQAGAALFVLAVMWLGSAIAGLRATVQRRYEDHHRWMVRNVAMTTAIVSMRVLNLPINYLMTTFMPAEPPLGPTTVFETAAWTAIMLHLLIAEWFVLRPRRRHRQDKSRRVATAAANV